MLPPPYGRAFAAVGATAMVTAVMATVIFGQQGTGVILIPLAALAFALAFAKRCERLRPSEPWLPTLLVIGVIVKIVASSARYVALTASYAGVGDATEYDEFARLQNAFWDGDRLRAPPLSDLRQSNFIRITLAHVYRLLGENLYAAFLLFACVALIGTYFWYRAVSDAVPGIDRRLFLVMMVFAPSIVYWPSSVGKEALMQVGVGAAAWATSLLLRGRTRTALPLVAGGGWLLWIIRPHMLALMTIAAAIAYTLGRVRTSRMPILARPAGMAFVAALALGSITAGADFLGMDDLSVESIEAELQATTERTGYGDSSFDPGDTSLSPVNLPRGLVTVLFRPFPWEAGGALPMLAATESLAVIGLIVWRRRSIWAALRSWRSNPFLLYCMLLLVAYGMTFSSFANFGLLSRQRSLVLPALYALIAVAPGMRGRGELEPAPAPATAPAGVAQT